MRKILFFAAIALSMAFVLSSCGTTSAAGGSGSGTSEAYMAGSNIGAALKTLYVQYKADGKVDFKNPTNLLQLASLASSYTTVKNNLKDKTIYADLATGLIAGSQKSVTQSTVDSVISTLGNVDITSLLNSTKNADASTTSGANILSKASTSISTILNLLK